MTLLVVGTYPVKGGAAIEGAVSLGDDGALRVGDATIPATMGSAALLGAAAQALTYLDQSPPVAYLAGDIGEGDGTKVLLSRLPGVVERIRPAVIVFHYLQPYTDLVAEAVDAVLEIVPDAMLVGDAGGMYAAKAAGVAPRFELLTPDPGEAGYLADPASTHPAYVSNFLLNSEDLVPAELARQAWETGGSGRGLIIKGSLDHIAWEGEVVATIDSPSVPALEAMGGTGDTITGLASAFLASGFPTIDAAVCACRANRAAGQAVDATPGTPVAVLIAILPKVLSEGLCGWAGVCAVE